jgi:hypothetical protein
MTARTIRHFERVSGLSGRSTAQRRPARADELALLQVLAASGPLPVLAGPLGRCLKRGWCTRLLPKMGSADGSALPPHMRSALQTGPAHLPRYAISQAGLEQLAGASSGGKSSPELLSRHHRTIPFGQAVDHGHASRVAAVATRTPDVIVEHQLNPQPQTAAFRKGDKP